MPKSYRVISKLYKIRLLQKRSADGERWNYILEYNCGGTRRRHEMLPLWTYDEANTASKKQWNKDTAAVAEKVMTEKALKMMKDEEGFRIGKERYVDFWQYAEEYYQRYDKADKASVKMGLVRFREFVFEKYPNYVGTLSTQYMTHQMMAAAKDWLVSKYIREQRSMWGATTAWERLRKVVRAAVRAGFLEKDPCRKLSVRTDPHEVRKEILLQDEWRKLIDTPFPDHPALRRAFIFSLYTGLRLCDIRRLRFTNISFENKRLQIRQSKVEGHSSRSLLDVPLADVALQMAGRPALTDKELVFGDVPHAANTILQRWIARAGITKHITWHCARHSFAVAALTNGADIQTVSRLLGHSSIMMTIKYLHKVDPSLKQAVDSLPTI
ncbi:MAG: tyrosine-type recombinase/integrase [Bacteroidaceae bacterium]|nr:tyrosine-type recombinase/integrase [Bacteroidaceae bacterium]